jgi:hypothetical protein
MMQQISYEDKMANLDVLMYHAKMAMMTLPKSGQCIVDGSTAVMDQEYFRQLGEYNSSLPSGTFIGKRWKRSVQDPTRQETKDWVMGEFVDIGSKSEIGIKWRKIEVIDGKTIQEQKATSKTVEGSDGSSSKTTAEESCKGQSCS